MLFRSVQTLRVQKGLQIPKNVFIKGRPYIRVVNGGCIDIAENVVLNSSNRKYHVNMYGPVKLIADGEGARVVIGMNSRIHGTCIHARGAITIGENCLIAANCQIIDSNGHNSLMREPEKRLSTRGDVAPIVIEDNVWIGMNSIILPGTVIKQGAVIAAGSVVRGEIPENSLYAGPSGSVVKSFLSC